MLPESLQKLRNQMGTNINTDASCINKNVGNALIKLYVASRPHLDTISLLTGMFIVD